MASMAFDTLRYARRLKAVGVPEPQADVQAELMAEAFGFYADNLLTRDHFTEVLNARFAEQDARLEQRLGVMDSKFERRLDAMDSKFEKRFDAMDSKFEQRLTASDSKFEQRFDTMDSTSEKRVTSLDAKFEQRFGKQDAVNRLHTWMLGLITLAVVIPQLQAWLS
ncbi:hypothetical protein R0135_03675 [Congregibacter variabilis]|uniref:DUF1640 domain-containing protein n=1 Tax=Congregibacter variabilis TaxID=3081200 RepID=A0ABZ0I420_9GAMM|nr:hypothetical protein R0135_03675 [Congregibacter sp. IMCC43200]